LPFDNQDNVARSSDEVRRYEEELKALEGVDQLDEQRVIAKENLTSTKKKIQQLQVRLDDSRFEKNF